VHAGWRWGDWPRDLIPAESMYKTYRHHSHISYKAIDESVYTLLVAWPHRCQYGSVGSLTVTSPHGHGLWEQPFLVA